MSDKMATGPSPPNNIPQLVLALILAVSAFVQFSVVSRTVVDSPLRADAGEYFNYAYNLHHYRTYSLARTWDTFPAPPAPAPDKIRAPGYPLFMLLAGRPEPTEKFGHRVLLMQAALGVGSTWLAYLIAASFLRRGLALATAFVIAMTPQLATISTYLLTEALFTFLLLTSVLLLIRATRSSRMALYVLVGVAWALTSLVRPTAQYFLPLLLLAAFGVPRLRAYRVAFAVALGTFALVMAPWVVRNQSAALKDPGYSLVVGTLAHGSYPGFMYDGRPETFAYPYRFDPDNNKITKDLPSVLKHIASRFKDQPAQYATWYLIGKPFYFLSQEDVQSFDIMIYPVSRTPYYEDLKFAVVRRISVALHWPLTILGLTGIALVLFNVRFLGLDDNGLVAARIVGALVLYAIAFHMVAAPFPRYSIPFRPLIYALAALPLQALWSVFRKS